MLLLKVPEKDKTYHKKSAPTKASPIVGKRRNVKRTCSITGRDDNYTEAVVTTAGGAVHKIRHGRKGIEITSDRLYGMDSPDLNEAVEAFKAKLGID